MIFELRMITSILFVIHQKALTFLGSYSMQILEPMQIGTFRRKVLKLHVPVN